MSTCYYNHPSLSQNQKTTLVNESSSEQEGSSFRRASVPTLPVENDEEYELEDEESEFKMGRLIRQASINSSHISSPPQQITKVMKGSSSLPRYLSQKQETNQEKISNMRKSESMNERNYRSKNSIKMGKNNNSGAPTVPGGWIDKGSSEVMKAQIKFWARAVAYNLHQEC